MFIELPTGLIFNTDHVVMVYPIKPVPGHESEHGFRILFQGTDRICIGTNDKLTLDQLELLRSNIVRAIAPSRCPMDPIHRPNGDQGHQHQELP